MLKSFADRYRRWFDYEKDSHAKVMAALGAVTSASRASPAFEKALTLMGHIVAARQLWLFRFGLTKAEPTEFFPKALSLSDLAAKLADVQSLWTNYLAKLDDEELARMFEYQSMEGLWFRNTIEEILAQLFGHSWYHRGQIASLLASIGAQPPVTDFVYWAREPISPPSGPSE